MNLTVPEIIILQSGAIVLGFVIHHFFLSKKVSALPSAEELQRKRKEEVDWKLTHSGEVEMKEREILKLKQKLADAEENLKIYEIEIEERSKEAKKLKSGTPVNNEELQQLRDQLKEAMEDNNILQIEVEERVKEVKKLKAEQGKTVQQAPPPVNTGEINQLKKQLSESQEDNNILQIEISELKKQIKELKAELDQSAQASATASTPGQSYYDQLQQAQQSLRQENERISRLLEQIDIIKEKEEKEKEIVSENIALNSELSKLRDLLSEKETEINSIQQKATLTREMTSMLDNAYTEFNVGSSRVDLQACKLEYSIVSPK